MQARIIQRAQQKSSDGNTHSSCRKLATTLGLRHRYKYGETTQRMSTRYRLCLREYRTFTQHLMPTRAACVVVCTCMRCAGLA